MRFSVFCYLVPFVSATEYCTVEQFGNLQSAMVTASASIQPGSYQTADSFVAAVLAALEDALGGQAAAAEYPCFACFSTYQTSLFSCITREDPNCSQQEIIQLASEFSVCATGNDFTNFGTDDPNNTEDPSETTKDSSVLAPVALTSVIATAAILRL